MRWWVVLLCLLAAACGERAGPGGKVLPETLVVVTRNAPTTWYEGRDGPLGPELELAQSFAAHLELPLRIDVVDSIGEVLQRINSGQAHIAAAGLTLTRQREEQGLVFGPEYYPVQQQVVCRRQHGKLPRSVEELVGKSIEVIADSSYVERLQELRLEVPELKW